jgi:hypothetical protein
MEGLVEGLSAAVFRGRVHPVELADRLSRHIDREGSDPGTESIPNAYTIRLNPAEVPEAVDRAELDRELAGVVASIAMARGWRLGGPTVVRVAPDATVSRGRIVIDGHREPGPLSAWAQLIDASAGAVHLLTDNRCEIGRAPESDVALTEPKISRRHAAIIRRDGATWVEDVGSANGTFVNDVAVLESAAAITTGDTIRFGPATFTFKLL